MPFILVSGDVLTTHDTRQCSGMILREQFSPLNRKSRHESTTKNGSHCTVPSTMLKSVCTNSVTYLSLAGEAESTHRGHRIKAQ